MKFLLSLLCIAGFSQFSFATGTSLEVLAEMNLARTSPQHYAQLLAERMGGTRSPESNRALAEAVSFLQKARPLPPLDFSNGLMRSAQQHVVSQGAGGGIGHGSFSRRVSSYGQWSGGAGENISYGHADARGIVAQLIIDQGVPGRGHRKNIFSRTFGVAGIACGSHARFGSMCVIDFAGGYQDSDAGIASVGSQRSHGS